MLDNTSIEAVLAFTILNVVVDLPSGAERSRGMVCQPLLVHLAHEELLFVELRTLALLEVAVCLPATTEHRGRSVVDDVTEVERLPGGELVALALDVVVDLPPRAERSRDMMCQAFPVDPARVEI